MAGPGSLRKRLQPELTELQHGALCRAADASLAVNPDPVLQRASEEMRRAWDCAEVDHDPMRERGY
jgi:hypothetical protein